MRYGGDVLARIPGLGGALAWVIEWLAMRPPRSDYSCFVGDRSTAASRYWATGSPFSSSPNGIDLDDIRNSYSDAGQIDVVTVGRLLPHKKISMLLESVALLHAEGIPVTCRIIGDGPQRAALHDQARELGIEDAVDFRHDVWEQKDVYSMIKAAKVAVFPSAREGSVSQPSRLSPAGSRW